MDVVMAIRTGLLGACTPLLISSAALAQPNLVQQQQALQGLLNNAIVAIQANNKAQACSLRAQALSILNANIQGFEAVFPANNWSDLQTSLAESTARCAAEGF